MNIMNFVRGMICKPCDNQYYIDRIETLSSVCATAMHTVGIPRATTTVEPRKIVPNVVTADLVYTTFSATTWIDILSAIHRVNPLNYTKATMDCDDFALVFAAIVAKSAYSCGRKYQPAFGIAWSKTHAFNVFIDDHNVLHVYEPQNNRVVCEPGEDYHIDKTWFMG